MDEYVREWDEQAAEWDVSAYNNQERAHLQQLTLVGGASADDTTLEISPLERTLPSNSPIWFPEGVTAITVGTHNAGATTLAIQPLSGDVQGPVTVPVSRAYSVTGGYFHVATLPNAPYRLSVRPTGAGGWQVRWDNLDLYDPSPTGYQRSVRFAMRFWVIDWAPTNTEISATFGRADKPDQVSALPGFLTSQSQYGIVERTLDAGIVNLDMEDAMSIAEAYVAANMKPRSRLTLEMAPGQPVLPTDINRRLVVPNNAGGTSPVIIESWEHTEMFDNTSASVTTRVTGVLTE